MDNLAQTTTEAKNGKLGPNTRAMVAEILNSKIASEIRAEAKGKKIGETVNTYGRNGAIISEYRQKGKEARLAAIPFNENDFENEIIRNNYRAGFVENGNNILVGMIDQLTPEQLETYGKNDYISGIQPNELPEKLKSNASYIVGYIMGTVLTEATKKGR